MGLAPDSFFSAKALRHEVIKTVFLIQAAFIHLNPGSLRHQIIGILDPRIDWRVLNVAVSVSADPVKFDEPIANTVLQ